LANVPKVNELLAGIVARADEIFAEAAIHLPAPALAAAWTLHVCFMASSSPNRFARAIFSTLFIFGLRRCLHLAADSILVRFAVSGEHDAKASAKRDPRHDLSHGVGVIFRRSTGTYHRCIFTASSEGVCQCKMLPT
jgi:hypothetical protein